MTRTTIRPRAIAALTAVALVAAIVVVVGTAPAVAACASEDYHWASEAVASGAMRWDLDDWHEDMANRGLLRSGIHYGGDRDIAESYGWVWDDTTCTFVWPSSTTSTTTTTTTTTPPPTSGTFIDDDGNVHESAIEAIAAEGVTRGCNPPTNNRYCPSSSLTRGQMAAFLRRALSLPSSTTDFFTDDNGSVFEDDINALAAVGITKGCNPPTSDRYCPDGNITREQMAAFLRRAFDYPAATIDYFVDDESSIFEGDINAIAQAGVTLGCNPPTNNRYCPTNLVKRDQMASFFARALNL